MKKKKTLKASFVVTVAANAAAIAAIGCTSEVITNPPFVECPAGMPLEGDDCNPDVGSCSYSDECGNEMTATCDGGTWAITSASSCNPPPVLECPATIPVSGDTCFGEGECQYTDECGLPVTATCPGSAWEVVYAGTCNPPPPCNAWTTETDCTAFPDCVWHEPGCGDPASIPSLPAAGCFSAIPCKDDLNCTVGTCNQVMVLPSCVEMGCDACGEAVNLCF
ncbi:MAG: hypothetical protein IPK82_37345 [Polyangiaceae bacterium]|nr:hypothetical protein [Polyangiaceae bacterium]